MLDFHTDVGKLINFSRSNRLWKDLWGYLRLENLNWVQALNNQHKVKDNKHCASIAIQMV